jgi:REP element-mobilizing transposase RayT
VPYAYGWHSRGYLPHFDAPRAIQQITYRLADSLPAELLAKFDQELLALADDLKRDVARRRRIEAFLDAGHGSCVLKHPEAARCVVETWLRFDAERYRLLAFVVMPNHCHVLIECIDACPLWKIINSWKSYTARWINEHVGGCEGLGLGESLGRAGARRSQALWQRDYWDRFIRDERHFRATRAYIENNPVAAGLVTSPSDWPWSSAGYDLPQLRLQARAYSANAGYAALDAKKR